MIIPITKNPGSNSQTLPPQLAKFGTDEVVLIEFQGSLEVEGVPDGQQVGTLTIDPKTDKPSMLIGHHLLEGKIASLPKPLAVMEKTSTGGDTDENESDEKQVAWNIVGIVKRKIVFSKRPMPVLATTRLLGLDRS